MDRNTAFAAAALALAASGAFAQANDAISQPGDPARWYVPADTPAKKYATLLKEAGAALQEARTECRERQGPAAERIRCEADARAQYDVDRRRAQGYLRGDQG